MVGGTAEIRGFNRGGMMSEVPYKLEPLTLHQLLQYKELYEEIFPKYCKLQSENKLLRNTIRRLEDEKNAAKTQG